MKNHHKLIVGLLGSGIVVMLYLNEPKLLNMQLYHVNEQKQRAAPNIHIVLVSCRQNLTAVPQNTLTLIKSILLYRPDVVFHIFTEEMDEIQAKIAEFARTNDLNMENFHDQFQIRPVELADIWRYEKFEKKWHCIAQYFFAAERLPASIEKVVKLDTDVIVLSDIQNLFSHFEKFNETQIMAAVSDGDSRAQDDLIRNRSQFPSYTPYLNSGVLLMHLGRMRSLKFTQVITSVLKEYLEVLNFADQDLLNIFFSNRRELLYLLPCSYNFRSEHCMLTVERCGAALEEGVHLLHGSSGVFANSRENKSNPSLYDRTRTFPVIQDAFVDYNLKQHARKALLDTVRQKLADIKESEPKYSCAREPYLLKAFQQSVVELQEV